MKQENEDAFEILEEAAKTAGFLSLQAMIDKMKELLPESEKKRYEALEDKVKQQGKDFELAFQVISGVGALGCFARLASKISDYTKLLIINVLIVVSWRFCMAVWTARRPVPLGIGNSSLGYCGSKCC
jgi:hypothetical protein